MSAPRSLRCSFCGKDQTQVSKLVAGRSDLFICDGCIDRCGQIIADPPTSQEVLGSPEQRAEALNLAVQLCRHGNWRNIDSRFQSTLEIAERFVEFIVREPRASRGGSR